MSLLVRKATVAAAAALGALSALGCLLAAYLELEGFGARRDANPRAGYLLALAQGLSFSIGVPALLWHALLPGRASLRVAAWSAALGAAGAILILGISLR